MPRNALIIFVKNPIEGKVKTRLAQTVGHEKATAIYRELLSYTKSVTDYLLPTDVQATVYYGDFVNENDLWNDYPKALQVEGDLGQRMKEAFREQFAAGAQRVAIIGSDCLELLPHQLEAAFRALEQDEVVIGASTDGGYYLLGMQRLHEVLFDHMPWSQPTLLESTVRVLLRGGLSHAFLDTLSDIDEWEDYLTSKLVLEMQQLS
ncbi:TIGR04282 family arsenosugar biosynthesis glycosyltransferase [Rhabdobacter roseus]|uniref:Glycosyltransferase n=1 Tax=Rhabdobacter roseus TaxID=1655419 RepID=A0A840TRY6_9BACT|nr:TIGR04282 family arsenosugar biosynthesis glycosyltransferase [Rhabdobacter roseus]MBB5285675.1 hypothetical protein [Rhabdobacter roseus]